MDLLSKITAELTRYAESLSPQTIHFWLRLLCLLTLPVIASAWTFNRGYRSVFVQVAAGVFGALLALSLPLEHIQINSGMARLWFLAFAVLVVAFIPAVLPGFLLPTLLEQKRLRKILICTIVALVLANLLWG